MCPLGWNVINDFSDGAKTSHQFYFNNLQVYFALNNYVAI